MRQKLNFLSKKFKIVRSKSTKRNITEMFGIFLLSFLLTSFTTAQELNLTLDFSTFLGGNGTDGCFIQADKEEYIYCMGTTSSSDFPFTTGAFDTTIDGNSDMYVCKFTPDGSELIYSTFLGGSGDESHSWFMKIDDEGCAYILGATTSDDFPCTDNSVDITYNGDWDLFIVKLNPGGTDLIYSTYLGGSSTDLPADIEVGANGNIYVSCSTISDDFPVSAEAFDKIRDKDFEIVVTKINPRWKEPKYSTFMGGMMLGQLAVDDQGYCLLAGYGNSDLITTEGVFGRNYYGGGADGYIAKLDTIGSSLIFASFLGGTDYDYGGDIMLDNQNSIVIYGATFSPNFPTTPGVYDRSYDGPGQNLFFTKMDPGAQLILYSSFLTGSYDGGLMTMTMDGTGNLYGSVIAYSAGLAVTEYAFDKSYNGYEDGYMLIYDQDLTDLLYASYLGTSGSEYAFITVGPDNKVITGGATSSAEFPVTTGAFQSVYGGGERDGFLMKFSLETVPDYLLNNKKSNINIYPNPVDGLVTISPGSFSQRYVNIEIYSIHGRLVYSGNADASDETTIDVSEIPKGIYILRIRSADYQVVQKITIE